MPFSSSSRFEQWIHAAQWTTPVSLQFSIQGHVSADTEAVNLCRMPHWTNDPWPRRIQEETPVRMLCSRLQNPPKAGPRPEQCRFTLRTHTRTALQKQISSANSTEEAKATNKIHQGSCGSGSSRVVARVQRSPSDILSDSEL